ncbi:IclR family transcriptional regulator [Arthrobacter sp. SLBN-100]|uniref:IclR family transcriptional regulator n=1 Tax=Arthrobacter sp. SLBN-100 TaxID=2768450 RepID=UPI001151F743|nr:IclR family transcriptional regulator [Arthrobacter sp. SLBN-100]
MRSHSQDPLPSFGSDSVGDSSLLSRAFKVLRSFEGTPVQSLTQIARKTGLPKSTAHRLIATLIAEGALEKHRSGYKIGVEMLRIGSFAPISLVRNLALGHMMELSAVTGASVHFAVLRHLDVRYVEVLTPTNCSWPTVAIGQKLPAHLTAAGKAIMSRSDLAELRRSLPATLPGALGDGQISTDDLISELRQVRRRGIIVSANEAYDGLTCVGAAIVATGFPVAAISLGIASSRQIDAGLVAALTTAIERITADYSARLDSYPEIIFPQDR